MSQRCPSQLTLTAAVELWEKQVLGGELLSKEIHMDTPVLANKKKHTQWALDLLRAGSPRGSGLEAPQSLDSNWPKYLQTHLH